MRIVNILGHRKLILGYKCLPYQDYCQTAEEHYISLFFWTVVIWTHNYPQD